MEEMRTDTNSTGIANRIGQLGNEPCLRTRYKVGCRSMQTLVYPGASSTKAVRLEGMEKPDKPDVPYYGAGHDWEPVM